MSKWSALVYGRTYEVDFRLIAMPKYFEDDAQASIWAEKHILATTQIPEKLPNSPRWSLFTNDKYCVIATTCMVKELFPNGISQETKDITTDFRGRPLYAFIGYVAKRSEQLPPLPAYSDLKLEQFQPLYRKYVEKCWDVKSYQPESRQPIPTSDDESISYGSLPSSNTNANIASISDVNSSQDSRLLFPETERETLWTAVANSVVQSSRHSISVCLGLSSQKEAVNSPFLNATASNVVTVTRTPVPVKVTQTPVAAKTVAKPIEPTQPRLSKPLETPTQSTANNSSKIGSNEQHIGGAVGGLVCGVVGGVIGGSIPVSGGIPGVILGATLGAGIGWIAGEIIASKTGELLGNLTSSPNTDRDINQIEYPNSNSQGHSQTKNQNIGFKPTDNSDNQRDDKNQESQKKPDNWF